VIALASVSAHRVEVQAIKTLIVMVLLLIAVFYHWALGVQVVIEDYLHAEWLKISALVLNQFVAIALAIAGIYAVLRIAFGS